jgi:hypothetical protein
MQLAEDADKVWQDGSMNPEPVLDLYAKEQVSVVRRSMPFDFEP